MKNLSTHLKVLGKIFVNPLKIGYLIGSSKNVGPNSKQRICEVRTPKGCISQGLATLTHEYYIPYHITLDERNERLSVVISLRPP